MVPGTYVYDVRVGLDSLDCDTSATKRPPRDADDRRPRADGADRPKSKRAAQIIITAPMAGGGADPTGTMAGSDDSSTDPLMMVAAASGVATLVLASGLAYVLSRRSSKG